MNLANQIAKPRSYYNFAFVDKNKHFKEASIKNNDIFFPTSIVFYTFTLTLGPPNI